MSLENNLSGFDCMDIRENEGGYDYYGFTRGNGTWRILRGKTDGTEYRIAVGGSAYEAAFTSRASLNYKLSNALPQV